MAFRVQIGGVTIECDSAAEASELASTLSHEGSSASNGRSRPQRRTDGHAELPSVSERYSTFFGELKGEARAALTALVASPDQLGTDELADKMKVGAERIKYAVRTIQTAAERNKIVGTIVNSKRNFVGGKPKSVYWISNSARLELQKTLK